MSKINKDMCKFCGDVVKLDDEGVTYGDGSCAHDHCHDGDEFEKANGGDFED